MKLTIFPSDKGDCSLLTGKDGKRILADGGMEVSYVASVAAQLAKLGTGSGNKKLDVVYVSHIDDDHIAGVLQMMDDLVAWRIHEHHLRKNNKAHKAPANPRPPDIGEIWHNGFRDLLEDNAGPIADQLAANALSLSGLSLGSAALQHAGAEHDELATSVRQAIMLSRRIQDGQLGIPLNRPAKGKLMMIRKGKTSIKVGGMQVHVLAPFEKDLEKLRDEWDKWLKKSKTTLAAINAKAKKDESELTATEFSRLLRAVATDFTSEELEKELVGSIDAAGKKLGRRGGITPPNLASLQLLVTEGARTVLYTGDGHANETIAGLKHLGLLKNGAGLHVDVMKVPHHGAADNMTDELAMTVTADHYVFCGNGFKTNPELVVIQRLFDARLGPTAMRSTNKEVSRPFTFWFNCSGTTPNKSDQKAHMKKVEALVKKLASSSKKKMRVKVLEPGQSSLSIR
jgi:hypothetical protein